MNQFLIFLSLHVYLSIHAIGQNITADLFQQPMHTEVNMVISTNKFNLDHHKRGSIDGFYDLPNLFPIQDINFLNYLQDNYPQTIINDSLDIDSTSGITEINLSNLGLTSIEGIQFFSDLTDLNCTSNHLTSISELPIGLNSFNCSVNNLTSLPELPEELLYLYCNNNNLTSLPELSQNLFSLISYNNPIVCVTNHHPQFFWLNEYP